MAIENDLRLEALVKQLTREISGLKAQVNSISMVSQGRYTSISGGGTTYYDENGNPVVVVGQQPDGTYSSQDFNGDRLDAPSDPIIEERAGTLTITWDGLDKNGVPYLQATFGHVEVHVSTVAEFQATNSTEVASFHARRGGSVVVALDPIEHYIQFTVVNTSRLESYPSTEISATPLPVSVVGGIATYYENTEPLGLGGDDVGSLWFDTDDGNHQYRWDGAMWVDVQDTLIVDTAANVATLSGSVDDISDAQDALVIDLADVEALAQTKTTISYASTRPTGLTATDRVTWMDPTNGYRAEYWNGSSWTVTLLDTPAVDFVARDIGSVTTFYGTTTPTGAVVGDIWYNQNFGNRPERWNGSAWVVVRDATIADAATAASAALTAANAAQAAADGAIRTWYQASAPTGLNNTTDVGDLWFDTDDGQAYRWNGTSWLIIEDNSIAAALAAAQNAQTTADSKILAYYQTSAPTGQTAADAGDLWYDTDDGNRPYYWTGSSWQTIRDTTIATAQAVADLAATTANAAILMDNLSTNPIFDDWPSTTPTGYVLDSGTPVKETTLVRTLPYALRFNPGAAAAGVQATTAWSSVPNSDYLTITVDLQLVSGSLTGSGVLLRWRNTVPTNFDATIVFATEIPTPQTGKWYRIEKTIQRPAGFTGTYQDTQGFLYANNTTIGALTAKNIIFDQFSVRPSSATEIQAFNSATAASVTSLTSTVNTKVRTFYQTAPPVSTAIGDLWVDTDDGNKLYRAAIVGADAIVAGEWESIQDGSIATAQTAANNALSAANGKNKVYYQAAAPTGGTYIDGDTWFDTDDGHKIYKRVSGAWVAVDLGSSALGTDSVTSTQIAANAVTASEILAGAVVAGKIGANAVTATEIAAGAVTASKLQVIVGGDNLQENSSIETATPVSWSSFGSVTLSRQNTQSRRTGTYALSVTPTATATGVRFNNKLGTRVQNGNNAVSSVWIKGTAANQVTIELRPMLPDANTTIGGTLGTRTWTLTGNWQRIYTDPAGASVGQDYRPNALITAATGTAVFYIDDVQSEEGDVPTSYKTMTDEILPGTIVATMIATNAITANEIAADAITASELAANAVTATKIQAGAVTTEKLTVGSVGDTAVLNGSFEETASADTTMPAGWTRDLAGSNSTTVRLATDQAATGTQSLKLTSTGSVAVAALYMTEVPAAVGEKWYLSARVRRSATGVGTYLRLVDQSGNAISGDTAALTENVNLTGSTWTTIENTYTVQSGDTTIRPYVMNNGPTGGVADLWVDDIVLKKITVSAQIADGAITASKIQAQAVTAEKLTVGSVGENVLLNGNLEELSTTTPTMAAGFVRGGYPGENLGVGSVVTSTSEFDSGTRSLQINVPATGTVSFSTVLPMSVVPGEQYHISFRAKAAAAHAGGLYMRPTNGSTEYTGNGAIENQALTTSWTTYESIFTVPAGVANLYWYWRGNSPNAANAAMTIYVDNVRVRRVITSAIIADGAITTNKVNASYVYTGTVTANQITSGSLSSTVALIGELKTSATGRSISLSSLGLKASDPSGDVVAFFPTDLGQDITLQADVIAESITALGVVALRSPANELAQGAKLIMGAAVAPPVTPPSLQVDWKTFPVGFGAGTWALANQNDSPAFIRGIAYEPSTTPPQIYIAHSDISSGAGVVETAYAEDYYDEINDVEHFAGEKISEYLLGSSVPGAPLGERIVHSVAPHSSGYYYALIQEGALYQIRRYSKGTATHDLAWPLSFTPNGVMAMCINDLGQLVVVFGLGLGGTINRRVYNRDTGSTISGPTATDLLLGGSGGYVGRLAVYEGLSDTGVRETWVSGGNSTGHVFCITTATHLLASNKMFYAAYDQAIGGLTYDTGVGRFKSMSATSGDLHVYEGGGNAWTSPPEHYDDWWVSNTWRDTNATGGTHETTMGPAAKIFMRRRARLQITAPPIPSDPNPANTDDPNAVSMYVSLTDGTTRTSMWRQTLPGDGIRNLAVTSVTFAGTNPPSTNNFPSATPGVLQSATLHTDGNPKFWVDGDGAGRWAGKVEDSGWIAPTFQNSWANYGSPWENAGYRLLNGVVHLRGLIRNPGARPANDTIFVLPTGYRSSTDQHCVIAFNGGTGVINIFADGRVTTNTAPGAGAWISLRNQAFPADQ